MKLIRTLLIVLCLSSSLPALAQDSQPVPIVRIQPHYPQPALNDRTEGWVKLKFTITAKGSVENAEVVAAEPPGVFDRAAIRAILKFKFKPAMKDGKPVSMVATQTIEFALPDNLRTVVEPEHELWQTGPMNYRVSWNRKYQNYTNQLVVSQASSGATVKVMPLPESYGHAGVLATHDDSPYLFYHHNISKKNGAIVVYDKRDFSVVREVPASQLNVLLFEGRYYRFYEMSADGQSLLAYVGSTRKPELLVIDAQTGELRQTIKMDTNTLIRSDQAVNHIWARRITPDGSNSARSNRINKAKLDIYDTQGDLSLIRSVKLTEKLWNLNYWQGHLIMVFEYEQRQPAYRLMALDLSTNTYPVDYYSSRKPVATAMSGHQGSLILAEQTSGSGQHLILHQIKAGEVTSWPLTGLNPDFNALKPLLINDQLHVDVYARNAFVRINPDMPEQATWVNLPINAADGLYSADLNTVWITEVTGPTVALVDIAGSRFIDKQNTGNPKKKFEQIMAAVLVSAITAPTGVMVTPVIGAVRSSNELFLNHSQTRLFALNLKTSDVTTFQANDLSDKHFVDTGKRTYQLYQGTHLPDLPVVAIAEEQLTYMDPNTGRQIAVVTYDQALRINAEQELIYRVDDEVRQISLHQIPEDPADSE